MQQAECSFRTDLTEENPMKKSIVIALGLALSTTAFAKPQRSHAPLEEPPEMIEVLEDNAAALSLDDATLDRLASLLQPTQTAFDEARDEAIALVEEAKESKSPSARLQVAEARDEARELQREMMETVRAELNSDQWFVLQQIMPRPEHRPAPSVMPLIIRRSEALGLDESTKGQLVALLEQTETEARAVRLELRDTKVKALTPGASSKAKAAAWDAEQRAQRLRFDTMEKVRALLTDEQWGRVVRALEHHDREERHGRR